MVVVGVGLAKQASLPNQAKFFLLFFVFVFLFSSSFCSTTGNGDFSILLEFKHSSDPANSLISWSNSSISSFCSVWHGVTCNPKTHRVTKLVLDNFNLTGSVQVLSQLTQLRHLSLHHNHLSVTPNLTTWPNLKHLYLSHNHFTGNFPPGISNLRRLRRLDLSYNYFSGEIPLAELTRLTLLLTLRLEFNWFNGTLGSDYSSLKSLVSFNVSENGLTGKIPFWLSKFPSSSFAGNAHLCGKPLSSDCPIKPAIVNPTAGRGPLPIGVTEVNPNKKKSSKNVTVLMIIVIDAVAVMVILLLIACCCYKRRYSQAKGRKKTGKGTNSKAYGTIITTAGDHDSGEMFCFEGCKGFSKVDELLKASAEMLGKGSVGTTYRVVLDGGAVVVVKRVREKAWRIKDVDGFLREIGGLTHPNIMCLRAYYSSKEELLLVYDYLQNGSLHNLLHGNRGPGRTPLDWPTRLRFALGSSGGLAFLHGYTKSKLCHGHLTSSNIIIDDQGNACISNIGLHMLLQMQSSSNNAYKAPELLPNNNASNNPARKYSQKCDVYSFGVVLLEILTGKMATSQGETSLVKWVQRVAREEWTWDVFDFELVRYKEMEQEMMALLQVAILCLASSPKDRPKMSVVHKMIADIRTKSEEEGIRSSIEREQSSQVQW